MTRRPRLSLFLACLIPLALGCQREAKPVKRILVPAEGATAGATSPVATTAGLASPHGPTAATGPQRLLAAIIPRGGDAWFFKVIGPAALVDDRAAAFRSLIESVTFAGADAPPAWTLPEGFTQEASSGMRYATVRIATAEAPLDLSVTQLKIAGELEDYILMNVDRWRDQVGLGPTSKAKLFDPSQRSGELAEVALKGDAKAFVVDVRGEGTAVATMPRTDTDASATLPPSSGMHGGAASASAPSYETPAGWTAGKAEGLRRAAFAIADGDRAAEVTVIALAAGAGDLLANVNLWRQQVGLEPTDPKGLTGYVAEVPVAGGTGQRVKLVGPADAKPRQAILGLILPRGDQVWFVKLKGDAALVEREEPRFDAFLRSLTFTGPGGTLKKR